MGTNAKMVRCPFYNTKSNQNYLEIDNGEKLNLTKRRVQSFAIGVWEIISKPLENYAW